MLFLGYAGSSQITCLQVRAEKNRGGLDDEWLTPAYDHIPYDHFLSLLISTRRVAA